MSMFCYQCEEAAKGSGCTVKGMCGKQESTANLQDLLVFVLKGIAVADRELRSQGKDDADTGLFVAKAMFATITNANFDDQRIIELIKEALQRREKLKEQAGMNSGPECVTWSGAEDDFAAKAKEVGVLSEPNEDVRSLHELLIYGVKGMCAYTEHAAVLGYEKDELYAFILDALASTTDELSVDEMTGWVLKCGEFGVTAMALLDEANTGSYGNPEISKVNLGVGNNPGILVSGHDMKDMEELLKQTEGTGVDVYTHSEMLPAHYYPAFKKYDHFVGNYGNSWWMQNKEFASFNGPIVMTTNCITPVKDAYKDRIYTTGMAGYPEVKHIPQRSAGGRRISAP